MSKAIRGVIQGRTIELTADPGLAEGEAVEVVVRVAKEPRMDADHLRIRREVDRLAERWTEDDDRILEEIALDLPTYSECQGRDRDCEEESEKGSISHVLLTSS